MSLNKLVVGEIKEVLCVPRACIELRYTCGEHELTAFYPYPRSH